MIEITLKNNEGVFIVKNSIDYVLKGLGNDFICFNRVDSIIFREEQFILREYSFYVQTSSILSFHSIKD